VLLAIHYLLDRGHYLPTYGAAAEDDNLRAIADLNLRLNDLMRVLFLIPAIRDLPELLVGPLSVTRQNLVVELNRLDTKLYPIATR
jgi:hypothetical protein